MPRCLGTSGLVRARQMPMSARAATEVHTFCPSRDQPPSTRVARVVSAARSEPAPGSLNSWHQSSSPRRVGTDPPLGLLRGAVGHDGGQGPGGHGQVGSPEAGLGTGLVDDQLLDGTGVASPRRRPVRGQEAGVGQGPPLLGRILEGGDGRPPGPPTSSRSRLGLGGQLDGEVAAPAGQGQAGGLGPQRCGAPDQLTEGGGPAEMDVGVVLPGEAHAAEDLDGPLGRLHVAVEGQGGGQLHGQSARRAWTSPPGPEPRPPGHSASKTEAASQVAATPCSTETSMSASRCLTPWNWPMGRPNCWRVRACSAAVSRHQRAPPTASAEATTRASHGSAPRSTSSSTRSGRHHGSAPASRSPSAGTDRSWPARRRRRPSPRSSRTHRTVPARPPGPAPWTPRRRWERVRSIRRR